jgi:branched-chain amino acid transport system ATP-binding protein
VVTIPARPRAQPRAGPRRRYAEALKRLRAALPDVAILITESNPELLRTLVEQTYVIERGEIAPG